MLIGTQENMHHFVEDIGQLNNPALAVYLERARGMYDDNMSTYVKMMLRRNFGRLMVIDPFGVVRV